MAPSISFQHSQISQYNKFYKSDKFSEYLEAPGAATLKHFEISGCEFWDFT